MVVAEDKEREAFSDAALQFPKSEFGSVVRVAFSGLCMTKIWFFSSFSKVALRCRNGLENGEILSAIQTAGAHEHINFLASFLLFDGASMPCLDSNPLSTIMTRNQKIMA